MRTQRKILIFLSALLLPACGLVFLGGCSKSAKKKVVVVPAGKPTVFDTIALPEMDIAMMSRSLVDALRIGEKLDSAAYTFHGILTDGSGVPIYTDLEGKPGVWDVEVESPCAVVIRSLKPGNLPAEDLRIYVAEAVGFSDADVVDAGIAEGMDSVQAVVYRTGNLRMEMTLHPHYDSKGEEHARMSIAFIRIKLAD